MQVAVPADKRIGLGGNRQRQEDYIVGVPNIRQPIGRHLDAVPQGITTAGNLVLYASLLLLFLAPRSIGRPNDDEVEEVVEKPPPPGDDVQPAAVTQMPCNIRLLLSERECLVLSHSLTGQTYRETAEKLAISESSVKTYMKRIYEKLEVSGRKELLQRLANL